MCVNRKSVQKWLVKLYLLSAFEISAPREIGCEILQELLIQMYILLLIPSKFVLFMCENGRCS